MRAYAHGYIHIDVLYRTRVSPDVHAPARLQAAPWQVASSSGPMVRGGHLSCWRKETIYRRRYPGFHKLTRSTCVLRQFLVDSRAVSSFPHGVRNFGSRTKNSRRESIERTNIAVDVQFTCLYHEWLIFRQSEPEHVWGSKCCCALITIYA